MTNPLLVCTPGAVIALVILGASATGEMLSANGPWKIGWPRGGAVESLHLTLTAAAPNASSIGANVIPSNAAPIAENEPVKLTEKSSSPSPREITSPAVEASVRVPL